MRACRNHSFFGRPTTSAPGPGWQAGCGTNSDTQTHSHTDTQTHRQTETQTHRHRHTHTHTRVNLYTGWRVSHLFKGFPGRPGPPRPPKLSMFNQIAKPPSATPPSGSRRLRELPSAPGPGRSPCSQVILCSHFGPSWLSSGAGPEPLFAGTLASMTDPPGRPFDDLRCDFGKDRHTDEAAELGLDLIRKYMVTPSMSPNQKLGAIHHLCCHFVKSRLSLCCEYEDIMFSPNGERREVAPNAMERASEAASSALARSLPKPPPPPPPPKPPKAKESSGCWAAKYALARCTGKKSRPQWKEEQPEPPAKKARPVGRPPPEEEPPEPPADE